MITRRWRAPSIGPVPIRQLPLNVHQGDVAVGSVDTITEFGTGAMGLGGFWTTEYDARGQSFQFEFEYDDHGLIAGLRVSPAGGFTLEVL